MEMHIGGGGGAIFIMEHRSAIGQARVVMAGPAGIADRMMALGPVTALP